LAGLTDGANRPTAHLHRWVCATAGDPPLVTNSGSEGPSRRAAQSLYGVVVLKGPAVFTRTSAINQLINHQHALKILKSSIGSRSPCTNRP